MLGGVRTAVLVVPAVTLLVACPLAGAQSSAYTGGAQTGGSANGAPVGGPVYAAKLITPRGGTVSGSVNGVSITVTVPSGALTKSELIAITPGSSSRSLRAASRRSSALRFAIQALDPASGAARRAAFRRALRVTARGLPTAVKRVTLVAASGRSRTLKAKRTRVKGVRELRLSLPAPGTLVFLASPKS